MELIAKPDNMSNYLDFGVDRLLHFLNHSHDADTILKHPDLKEDPTAKERGMSGYVIGETVAQRIIEHRSTLPNRRYETVEDILSVSGLGDDKLNDLVHSFSTPADDAFRSALFQPNGPLMDNWELNAYTLTARKDDEFLSKISGLDNLRMTTAELLPEHDRRRMQIRTAYVATFPEPHLASYQFANWWYGFDQDNWFSFEGIREVCEAYLNYHGHSGKMIFGFLYFYGNNGGTFNRLGTYDQIPFVINRAERKFTLWQTELND